MMLAARTARFLLLFAFVAVGFLSAACLVQGGNYAAEESNLVVVPERKAMQTTENMGGKMVTGYYDLNMKMEEVKEKSEKPRKLMHRENYEARFVAFNADYRGPRHHPPKNN